MSLLTKKIPTVLALLLLLVGVIGAVLFFRTNRQIVTPDIVPNKVRITNISDNKFSVSWVSQSPTIGAIEYGVVGESLTNKAYDERDTPENQKPYNTHHVTITALQPNTQYAFRILSGDDLTRFDNNGSPYTSNTGPVIANTPPSANFYGNVELASTQAASGSIVYLTLPGGTTASTLVPESGNYAFTLSTIRSADLRSYVAYDPSATIANITVESGNQQANSAVSLENSAPVPTITLGQNVDFLSTPQTPVVAEIDETDEEINEAETPPIFNVEPLVSENEINVVGSTNVTLLNPKEVGETLFTLRPEFRGTGPVGTVMTIAITGQKAISDSVEIGDDGTWSWAPVVDLRVGKQVVTLSYNGSNGTAQKISREFNVSTSQTGLDPAFVSSPSASTVASASPTPSASASATPRVAMPDTEEGVPVSGVLDNTLWSIAIGASLFIVGIAMFVI